MNSLKNLGSAIASGYGYVTNEVWTFSSEAKTDIAKAFKEFKGIGSKNIHCMTSVPCEPTVPSVYVFITSAVPWPSLNHTVLRMTHSSDHIRYGCVNALLRYGTVRLRYGTVWYGTVSIRTRRAHGDGSVLSFSKYYNFLYESFTILRTIDDTNDIYNDITSLTWTSVADPAVWTETSGKKPIETPIEDLKNIKALREEEKKKEAQSEKEKLKLTVFSVETYPRSPLEKTADRSEEPIATKYGK